MRRACSREGPRPRAARVLRSCERDDAEPTRRREVHRPRVARDEPTAALRRSGEERGERSQAALTDPVRDPRVGELARELLAELRLRGARDDQHVAPRARRGACELGPTLRRPRPHVAGRREREQQRRVPRADARGELARACVALRAREPEVEALRGFTLEHERREVPHPRERMDSAVFLQRRRALGENVRAERFAPVLASEPDAPRRSGRQRDERALCVALRVDGEVGAERGELARQARPGPRTAPALEHEDPVETGQPSIAIAEQPGELRLHDPSQLGGGETLAQRVEHRQGVHDVAEVREAHEQDPPRVGTFGVQSHGGELGGNDCCRGWGG